MRLLSAAACLCLALGPAGCGAQIMQTTQDNAGPAPAQRAPTAPVEGSGPAIRNPDARVAGPLRNAQARHLAPRDPTAELPPAWSETDALVDAVRTGATPLPPRGDAAGAIDGDRTAAALPAPGAPIVATPPEAKPDPAAPVVETGREAGREAGRETAPETGPNPAPRPDLPAPAARSPDGAITVIAPAPSPPAPRSRAYMIESVSCRPPSEARVLLLAGGVTESSTLDAPVSLRVADRLVLYFDATRDGADPSRWECVPLRRYCYEQTRFEDWGGSAYARRDVARAAPDAYSLSDSASDLHDLVDRAVEAACGYGG